jgi:hypothetical protein
MAGDYQTFLAAVQEITPLTDNIAKLALSLQQDAAVLR